MHKSIIIVALLLTAAAPQAGATATENYGILLFPAPGRVTIDGRFGDWDLTGGVFVCGDVEHDRAKASTWFHAMYDQRNVYLLARFKDETPLNNASLSSAGYRSAGDSLQVRFLTGAGTLAERVTHVSGWRGRDERDVLAIAYGRRLDQPGIKDARMQGADEAFLKDPDGKGYTQEIAIPWKLITADGEPLPPGTQFRMAVEPGFTVGTSGRMTIKDLFKAGVSVDRVFIFMNPGAWGAATLQWKEQLAPRPVRLAGGREFLVRLVNGMLVVDWSGL